MANGGSQHAESRFTALLAKGNAEASGARRGAGIAGPWEPVPGPREVKEELLTVIVAASCFFLWFCYCALFDGVTYHDLL